MKCFLLVFVFLLAQVNATCSSYTRQIIAPTIGYASPFWWTNSDYPEFYVAPCTVLNFGKVQNNMNVVPVPKVGFYQCGGDDHLALEAKAEASPGLWDKNDVVYIVEDVTVRTELFFIDTFFKHCANENTKVSVVVLAEAKPWNMQLGTSEEDRVRGVTFDSVTGHIIMVGDTRGGFDENANDGKSNGGWDGWIAAVDGLSGKLSWKAQEGTHGYERFLDVATDPTDASIWVLGETDEGLFSSSASDNADGIYSDGLDVFIVRFDSFGDITEHVLIGGTGMNFAVALEVLEGGDIAVLVAHSDSDHRYLGDGSTYGGDMVMRVYRLDPAKIRNGSMGDSLKDGGCDSDNGCKWMKEFATDEGIAHTHQDSDTGMGDGKPWRDVNPSGIKRGTLDGEEVLYVVGQTAGSNADLGGSTLFPGGEGYDGFLTQISASDGTVLESARVSSGMTKDGISGVCVTEEGDPIVVGYTKGDMTGGVAGNGGKFDMFARMYNRRHLDMSWTRQMGGEDDDFGYDCTAGRGEVYVLGRSRGGTGGWGGWDARLIKIVSNTGIIEWDEWFGTAEDDMASDSRIGSSGGIILDEVGGATVAGSTRGGWGGQRLGNWDAFIAHLSPSGEYVKAYGRGTVSEGAVKVDGGEGGMGKEAEAGIAIAAAIVGVSACVMGFLIGTKRTEQKYNRLKDGGGGVGMTKITHDEDMDL